MSCTRFFLYYTLPLYKRILNWIYIHVVTQYIYYTLYIYIVYYVYKSYMHTNNILDFTLLYIV